LYVPALVRAFHHTDETDSVDDLDLQQEDEPGEEDNGFNAVTHSPTPVHNPSPASVDVNGFFEIFDPDASTKPAPTNTNSTQYNTNARETKDKRDGNEADNDSDELEEGGGYFYAWERLLEHVNSPFGSTARAATTNPRTATLPEAFTVDTHVINEGKSGEKAEKLDEAREQKRLSNLKPLTRIVQLACGGFHTVAISDKHQLYSWGYGEFGQLGGDWQEDDKHHKPSASLPEKTPTVKDARECSAEVVEAVTMPSDSLSADRGPTQSPHDTMDTPQASQALSSVRPSVPPTVFAPVSRLILPSASTAITACSLAPNDHYQLQPQSLSLPGKVMFASVGMWHTMVIVRYVTQLRE
jgi:hypothetical protein